jgi:hypothetical protein
MSDFTNLDAAGTCSIEYWPSERKRGKSTSASMANELRTAVIPIRLKP